MINKESIDKLESSGIIDAYEYVMRKLIQNDLPKENCYEKCAYYLIEYQKLILEHNIRAKGLKNLLDMPSNEEKPVKQEIKLKEVMPSYKITLKSKLLLESEDNVKFEDKPLVQMNIEDLINNRIDMASEKVKKNLEEIPVKYKETFSAYVNEENSKLRSFIFKTAPKMKPFELIPIKEISRLNLIQNQKQNSNQHQLQQQQQQKQQQQQEENLNQKRQQNPDRNQQQNLQQTLNQSQSQSQRNKDQFRHNPNVEIKDDPQDNEWENEPNPGFKR